MRKLPLLGAPLPHDFDALVTRASELSGVPAEKFFGKTRGEARVAQWRMALYHAMRHRGSTFAEIASYFGRTHGTIIHGCNSISDQADVSTLVQDILTQLGSTGLETINKEPTQ